MAKKSMIAAQGKREALVAKFEEKRAALKETIRSTDSAEEREAAVRQLSSLPRNSSKTRLRNRDASDGRPRAYLRKFGLSRVKFREMAHKGQLPGVSKSSW